MYYSNPIQPPWNPISIIIIPIFPCFFLGKSYSIAAIPDEFLGEGAASSFHWPSAAGATGAVCNDAGNCPTTASSQVSDFSSFTQIYRTNIYISIYHLNPDSESPIQIEGLRCRKRRPALGRAARPAPWRTARPVGEVPGEKGPKIVKFHRNPM